MIELSFITCDSLNSNHLCGNPSQCEGFETTKRNRPHTVSPVLSLVLLPLIRFDAYSRYCYYKIRGFSETIL